jgi:hypothetical protein
MKKTMLLAILGLVAAGIPVFAGGIFNRSGGQAAINQSGTIEAAETPRTVEIAEAAELAEVPNVEYEPRQNPGVQQAVGRVYALPATPLSPEAERLPPPVYAISGVRGQEISEGSPLEAVDIVINLPDQVSFSRGILEGEDVSGWIRNLPTGLEARAHGIKSGDRSIKIYISGTPTVTMREVIRVNIPGTYLSGGASRDFVSANEEESFGVWEAGQTR